jgi:Tfp pilus assembly protein PilO
MSMTERDKKILTLLLPVALIAAYWFLLFAPKREESVAIQEKLSQAQTEQQTAESQAASVSGAKQNFNADYTTVIRLGKAVPDTVDMPSLLVQLDRAARGTGIDFDKISTGERTAAPTAATPPAGGSAQSGPGKAKQAAQGAAGQASSTGTLNGAQPAAAGATGTGATGTGAPGLETIPLDFTFEGTFFDLADFFHRMKRFVRVANDDIVVRGRLMTIDSFNWKAEPDKWPYLTAEVHASVYLAPKAEGVSAGATPQGPGATPATPAASSTPAAPSSTPATTAPAATVK